MSAVYESGCGGSQLVVQDDGYFAINGDIPRQTPATFAFPAYQPPASPRGVEQYADSVWKWSNYYALPASIVAGDIARESNGQANAMNFTDHPNGAGLMQLTSLYAKQGHSDAELTSDPDLNIQLGCKYLAEQWSAESGNPIRALARYNAGHIACRSPGHNEWNLLMTGDYVSAVLKLANHFVDGAFNPNLNPNVPPPPPCPVPPCPGEVASAVRRSAIGPIAGIGLLALAFGIGYAVTKGR